MAKYEPTCGVDTLNKAGVSVWVNTRLHCITAANQCKSLEVNHLSNSTVTSPANEYFVLFNRSSGLRIIQMVIRVPLLAAGYLEEVRVIIYLWPLKVIVAT